jgi:hypothetical protein
VNIAAAQAWVENLSSGGGTNLYEAIEKSVNRPLDNARANIAFIITDGEPTSGVTEWSTIQDYVKRDNSFEKGKDSRKKWALFNFAIGGNAPMTELNKLSILNMGQAKQVLDDSDVHHVLTEWYDEFSVPLIWNYGNGAQYQNVQDYDCNNNYNLFADRELVCVGEMKGSNKDSCVAPSVTMASTGSSVFSFDHQNCPVDIQCTTSDNDQIIGDPADIMTNPIPRSKAVDLKKVYAYQQMKKMLDYYHSLYDENHKMFLKTKIEKFAVQQDFVTEFTSLVVVQSDAANRNRRGVQMIPIRPGHMSDSHVIKINKKRSEEKKKQLKQYFDAYNSIRSEEINGNKPDAKIATPDKMSDNEVLKNSIILPAHETARQENIRPSENDHHENDRQNKATILYISLIIVAYKLMTSRKARRFVPF